MEWAPGHEAGGHGFPAKVPPDVEMRDSRFHQSLIAEWFGTTVFVLFLVLTIMTSTDPMRVGLVAGLTFFGLTYMLYGVSGAHFNPAVTLGIWASRRMTTLRAFCYMIFQLLGGLTGAALARSVSITMFKRVHGGSNFLVSGVSQGSAFWIELLGTMFLVMAVLAATDTERVTKWPHRRTLLPLEVGLTIFLVHVVLIPFTGCSINPARSFGPAVVGHYWRLHWIWWVAPLIGGLVASLLYSIIFFYNEEMPEEKGGAGGGLFGSFPTSRTSGTQGGTTGTSG